MLSNGGDCTVPSLHVIAMFEVSVWDTEDIIEFTDLLVTTCLTLPVGLGTMCGTIKNQCLKGAAVADMPGIPN